MRKKLKKAILEALKSLDWETKKVELEHPQEESHGDYSSSVALKEAAKSGKEARKLAEELVGKLEEEGIGGVEEIKIAGAGFINFYLSEEWLISQAERVIKKGERYGRSSWGKEKRMLIDYSAPNIAKQFSVGHLRSTIIGQAIYNLYDFSGWETIGDNHLGDWGTQFGMIIAAVEEEELEVEKMSVEEMEELYVEYNKKAKENEEYKDKAREAFARLEKGEEKARKIWEEAVKSSMEEFVKVYDLLDVKIDMALGESFYEDKMDEVIKEAKKKGLAVEGEGGAQIVEFDDMPPAMLVKSDGATTYFTRDLATVKHRTSSDELKSDLYIYEVGAEQKLHFRQVFAAAQMLGWISKDQLVHVAHGLVLDKEGKKMSTRKGTTESMEELLVKAIEKAESIDKKSAKKVGVGAVKFNDLKHEPQTSYRFDWDQALSLEGDSGPYLQYTAVRSKSVIEKSKKKKSDWAEVDWEEVCDEGKKILRWMYRFPEKVKESTVKFAPNILAAYLLELGQRYNSFYNTRQIIDSENEDLRLLITAACGQILENGLGILGLKVPKKM